MLTHLFQDIEDLLLGTFIGQELIPFWIAVYWKISYINSKVSVYAIYNLGRKLLKDFFISNFS